MSTPLKDFTKSVGLSTSWSAYSNATVIDIPVLRIPTHPNFRSSNNKRQSWNMNIRCHDYRVHEKPMPQGFMYRRQFLLACTALSLKPQQMMAAIPSPSNLTDYHNLVNDVQQAQNFKDSAHCRAEINDRLCWFCSPEPLKPPNSRSPEQLSGVGAAPPVQELLRCGINEKEVFTARVRRSEAIQLRLQDKAEQVVLQGIEVTDDKPLCFDVYVKLEQEREEEYVGTFSHKPPRRKQRRDLHNNKAAFDGRHEQKRVRKCCLRLGMNDILIDRPLNAHQAESVIVKLVPTFKLDGDRTKVESIFIDYK